MRLPLSPKLTDGKTDGQLAGYKSQTLPFIANFVDAWSHMSRLTLNEFWASVTNRQFLHAYMLALKTRNTKFATQFVDDGLMSAEFVRL
ncbi:MAG: hypothetical protein N3B10_06325 [Armatimonadetes bacterium]|nr:hypothetical protein [Armatimonadota bacterium]MCX7968093.1 hypothetical protein [Armatimonadota bacterium]MDW8144396.1 hypothetical protein [Armatimonadota bacterium]